MPPARIPDMTVAKHRHMTAAGKGSRRHKNEPKESRHDEITTREHQKRRRKLNLPVPLQKRTAKQSQKTRVSLEAVRFTPLADSSAIMATDCFDSHMPPLERARETIDRQHRTERPHGGQRTRGGAPPRMPRSPTGKTCTRSTKVEKKFAETGQV